MNYIFYNTIIIIITLLISSCKYKSKENKIAQNSILNADSIRLYEFEFSKINKEEYIDSSVSKDISVLNQYKDTLTIKYKTQNTFNYIKDKPPSGRSYGLKVSKDYYILHHSCGNPCSRYLILSKNNQLYKKEFLFVVGINIRENIIAYLEEINNKSSILVITNYENNKVKKTKMKYNYFKEGVIIPSNFSDGKITFELSNSIYTSYSYLELK